MSQAVVVVQAARAGLKQRSASIKRAAGLTALDFGRVINTSFTVTASWGAPRPGSFSKEYNLSLIADGSPPAGLRLKKTHCRFRDDLIREILASRGVL